MLSKTTNKAKNSLTFLRGYKDQRKIPAYEWESLMMLQALLLLITISSYDLPL